MNTPIRCQTLFFPTAAAAIAMVFALAATPAHAKDKPGSGAEDESLVECRLPPQIRTLGRNMTYLAAGRQVRISASDCGIRGGSHDGRGPGSKAGHETAAMPGAGLRSVVTVGGDESRNGCPGSGLVAGLSKAGTLSVRSGPGTASARVHSLGNGSKVFMCDWSADGGWVGVVYPGTPGADCGVSRPITPAQPYAGPCRSGWVSAKYLQ